MNSDKAREQARLRKQRQRDKTKGNSVTLGSVTSPSVTSLLHRPNGEDYNPNELSGGRKRYLGPLSDGQVLDRLTVPEPSRHIPEMIACNRADAHRLRRG